MPTPPAARSLGHRAVAFTAALFVIAVGMLYGPVEPALGAPTAAGACSTADWQDPANFDRCVNQLPDLSTSEAQCVTAPTPEEPDSGMAGWFASKPAEAGEPGPKGKYTTYGYAGYDFTTYDTTCLTTPTSASFQFENEAANVEFMVATGIIGAANALREKAWDPQSMWGWADPLVQQATTSIYRQVFTAFGAVTLGVIGLYLLWRSRQSDMSNAMTTAGWALLVMTVVTAIAAWPVSSAHVADSSLVNGLDVVHSAVGPPSDTIPPDQCHAPDPNACVDHRPPALRASDTAVQTMLYNNWLRGTLGSSNSATAQKYGPVLYDAKSFSWQDEDKIRQDPNARAQLISQKQSRWEKVAKQIKTEDPEAYVYLQGTRGVDRIGAGFIAILSALFFALFDIVASILVLLGFLIFRWAVIAAPLLGTIGMLRPASGGFRRLVNAVIAAVFNVILFGTGAAIYLFAVDLIMNTASLPGWLQVTLVWLCGVVGWLLLRPYRRITQLGGKDATSQIANPSAWHRRFFRDLRHAATLQEEADVRVEHKHKHRHLVVVQNGRPETRVENEGEVRTATPARAADRAATVADGTPEPAPATSSPAYRRDVVIEPEYRESPPPGYVVYRPDGLKGGTVAPTPERRPESTPVRG